MVGCWMMQGGGDQRECLGSRADIVRESVKGSIGPESIRIPKRKEGLLRSTRQDTARGEGTSGVAGARSETAKWIRLFAELCWRGSRMRVYMIVGRFWSRDGGWAA